MSYSYIYTLKSDVSFNNLISDYDAFRYFIGTDSSGAPPTSLQTLIDISFLSFQKNPDALDRGSINMNDKILYNVKSAEFNNLFCKYFKIKPNRNIEFNNLKIQNKQNTDISFKLWTMDSSGVYTTDNITVNSVNVSVFSDSDIILEPIPEQSVPYYIISSLITTDNIFVINSDLNIKWRVYGTDEIDWNYTNNISYGTYDISGLNAELQNILLTNNAKIFDTSAIDITTYPNFTLSFNNKYFTIIEISNDSSLFDVFTLSNNSNIMLSSNQDFSANVTYQPYKNTPIDFTYTYSDNIYSSFYTYVSKNNIDFVNPHHDLAFNDISNSLSDDITISLFTIETQILNVKLENYLKETQNGFYISAYDASYGNIDCSTCDVSAIYANDISSNISICNSIISKNIDASNIITDNITITESLGINTVDISNLTIKKNLDLSGSIINKNVDLYGSNSYIDIDKYNYKYVRFDISGDISFSNFRFYDNTNVDVSFMVWALSGDTYNYMLSDTDISFNYSTTTDTSSIVFEFINPLNPGFYYTYDRVDLGNIFTISGDNNQILYQPYDPSFINTYYIKAELPYDKNGSDPSGTRYSLADINNFLKEGTGNTKNISYFNSDVSAVHPEQLDTSGIYTNTYGIKYTLMKSTTYTAEETNSNFIYNELSFNILSEALFSSWGYSPLTVYDVYDDKYNEIKILLIIEGLYDYSHNLINGLVYGISNINSFFHTFFKTTTVQDNNNTSRDVLDVSYILLNDLEHSMNLHLLNNNWQSTSLNYIKGGGNNMALPINSVNNENIKSNGDRLGILLTLNDKYTPVRNNTINIYHINHCDNILISDITKSSDKWILDNSNIKYKNKYFTSERYQKYFDTQDSSLAILNYSNFSKDSILSYNETEIYVDDVPFINSKVDTLGDTTMQYKRDNSLSIEKKILAKDISCDNFSLIYESYTEGQNLDSSNIIVSGNATFNNGISSNFDASGGGIYVDAFNYLDASYSDSNYDISNSVVKLAYDKSTNPGYNVNNFYRMNILSAAGDSISDQSGTEAGWEITAMFREADTSYNRAVNKHNIRMVPSAIYYLDPSAAWRTDASLVDGLTSFQIDADQITYNNNYVSSDDRIKFNEKDISNALTTINSLKPIFYIKTEQQYTANHTLDPSNLPTGAIYESGYIAQDVAQITELKHVVNENSSKMSIDYAQIEPFLCKAIQELHNRIILLKQRLDILENN